MNDKLRWRQALVGVAAVLFVVAVILECMILFKDQTKTVQTKRHTVTTVVEGSPPSTGLVTGALGLAVVSLLVAAFWDRITKISVAGVDLEFDAALAAKVGDAARQATQDRPELFVPVFTESWNLLQSKAVKPETTQYVARPGEADPTAVEDSTAWRAVQLAMQSVMARDPGR